MTTILNKIKQSALHNPNKTAYKVRNESITYRDLWNRASRCALLLKKQGTAPVIIYGQKEIAVVVSILSCLLANRTYVPVGSFMPLSRVKQIVSQTNASLILTERSLKIDGISCLSPDELIRFEQDEIQAQENEIAYIMFTSGSTGTPKGVPISKANLAHFVGWICALEPLCGYRDINVLNQAGFGFDLSVADFYYTLCGGHTLIAADAASAGGFGALFDCMKEVHVAVMTPTCMKLCLLDGAFHEKNYSLLRCVFFCGEPLDVKTVRKLFAAFPSLKILNAYGPTEATCAVSAIAVTKEMAERFSLLPVGEEKTFATEIEISDGEIVLKGKSVFGGYLSGKAGGWFRENGINCYRTGDLGYLENGMLFCKGRKDSQIKFKGYRIELQDIEYNLHQIEGVKDCAVIAKYTAEGVVKTLQAFVAAADGVDAAYLKTELGKRVPEYMIPKTIRFLDRLPVNRNGKTDRKALQTV